MQAVVVNNIVCPSCDAHLPAEMEACGRCGASTFDAPAPKSMSLSGDRALNKPWVIVVMILHVGLLGIPVYWKLNYSKGARWMIIIASILYTIFAVVAIVWMTSAVIRQFQAFA